VPISETSASNRGIGGPTTSWKRNISTCQCHFVEEEYIYMPVPSKARLGNSARIILLGISCYPFHRWIISVVDLVKKIY
jgi:hypothetical protein